MSTLIDFSIFPVGKGESVSPYVKRAAKIIKDSNLPFKLGPMGTSVEGEWEELMAMLTRCLEDLKQDCSRVYMNIKVDYRKTGANRIEAKVKAVDS
jgi:uncharacterized protein (TIGR00106 family)